MSKLKGASAFSIPSHLPRNCLTYWNLRQLGSITLKRSGILFSNFPRTPQSHERILLNDIDLTHSQGSKEHAFPSQIRTSHFPHLPLTFNNDCITFFPNLLLMWFNFFFSVMKIFIIYLFITCKSPAAKYPHQADGDFERTVLFCSPSPRREGWLVGGGHLSSHMLFSLTVACFGGGEGFYQLIPVLYTRWLDIFVYQYVLSY